MPRACAVVGCSNRANREFDKKYFLFPGIRDRRGNDLPEGKRRRQLWVEALHRIDFPETKIRNACICSDHFQSGYPSEDPLNVDYYPHLNMGYGSSKNGNTRRARRYKNRERKLAENAALCDQVAQVQENILIAKEERRFLLKKLYQYEPQSDGETQQPVPAKSSQHIQEKKPHRKQKAVGIPAETSEQKNKTHSRKTNNARMRKKVVQQIPLDCTGRPVFPIELGGLTVHSLGEVVTDRVEFHTEDVIYPVGYVSTRVYGSLKDPIVKCVYTCKISDHNGVPRFDITADNNLDVPIIGSNPDICHTLLLQHINDSLQMDVVNIRPRGNEFFGLSHPTILNLIQSSPGTRKCLNYKWTKFEVGKNPDSIDENDPCLNFDSLQRNINFSNLNTVTEIKLEPPEDFMENSDSLRDFLMN